MTVTVTVLRPRARQSAASGSGGGDLHRARHDRRAHQVGAVSAARLDGRQARARACHLAGAVIAAAVAVAHLDGPAEGRHGQDGGSHLGWREVH